MVLRQKFGQEVKSFSFGNFESSESNGDFKTFNFQDLSTIPKVIESQHQEIIRKEREFEASSEFKIDGMVKELRGLNKQEQNDLEGKISAEVKKRVLQIQEKAYADGLEKGRLEGADEALKEALLSYQDQVVQLKEIIQNVELSSRGIITKNRIQMLETVKRLLKWLTLKEVHEDGYLPRLMEKLVHEINQKHHLVVRVNKEQFSQMDSVIKIVEDKVGELTNVRVEIDLNQSQPGIIIDTENGILDASLEALYKTLDHMFNEVIHHEPRS